MALFLREDDVKQVLTMPLALDRVAAAFRYLGLGEAIDLPRERVRLPQVSQQLMQGAVPALNVIGYKHSTNSTPPLPGISIGRKLSSTWPTKNATMTKMPY